MYTLKITLLFIFCYYFSFSQTNEKLIDATFIENKGQVYNQDLITNTSVLYSGSVNDLVYHLKSNSISYQLSKATKFKEIEDLKLGQIIKSTTQTTIYRIDVDWLGSNKSCVIEKGDVIEGYTNYYNAACINGIHNVKSYKALLYKNLYDGIDLKWYSSKGSLKYDFIVKANANPNTIKLQINGAQSILINKNGELEIKTPLGTIIEQAPIAYQGKNIIKTKWVLKNNCASFLVEKYNQDLPLIIDPALRIWGTYYGGTGIDHNYGCSTDANGNVFICGYTQSNNGTSIATSGSYQSIYAGGTNDSYLAKFNTNGIRQWATYYGGATLDVGSATAIDNAGNIYMSGYTDSNSGISSSGAHQTTLNGNVSAFLVKFNTLGARIWATYYGGLLNDYGYFCATDQSGNVYLSGNCSSTNGTDIATSSSHQSTHGGSTWDGYLVKFNSNGVRLWGTYYGGFANEYGYNCATDASGNVYFVGRTYTNNGNSIATVSSHQPVHGGSQDAFLVKFNSSGSRQWGTYYGGFDDEYGYGVTTDALGNVYLSGSSNSIGGTVIATPGSYQQAFGGGFADAFIAKFNTAGNRQWGTFYGGSAFEEGVSCATDVSGNVYLTGQTGTTTNSIITTSGAHQPNFGGGFYDCYLVKFNSTGIRQWGTYYGETGEDYALVCTVDNFDNVYMAGKTSSGSSIASNGAHQTVYGGNNYDGFLVKFFECQILNTDINYTNVSCYSTANGSATVTAIGGSGFTFTWFPTGGNSIIASNLSAGIYSCVITNSCGSTATETCLITQASNTNIAVLANTTNSIICSGSPAVLNTTVTGGNGLIIYNWSNGAQSNSITVNPTTTTIYTVTINDSYGCTANAVITQSVDICTGLNESTSSVNNFACKLFPNPNNGEFYITIPYLNETNTILLYNSLGQLILKKKITNTIEQINLLDLPNGLYELQLFQDHIIQNSFKIIKEY